MNLLMVSSECYPFVKVGGLGDVIYALPKELNKNGCDARVILPKYKSIKKNLLEGITKIANYYAFLGPRPFEINLYELKKDNVTYYFIENEKYFNRDNIYGYEDDIERWALFQLAVIDAINYLDYKIDIINCHDWHTAMIPEVIKARYFKEFGSIKTLLTIHNVAFQGITDRSNSKLFNLDFDSVMDMDGKLNFLKCGIVASDYVNTVSETFVKELIDSNFFSMGLSNIFMSKYRKGELFGILNGIDYDIFDPLKDEYLPLKYNFDNFKEGKLEAKKQLYKKLKVDFYDNVPLIAIVSRLTKQKGLDLLLEVIENLMKDLTFKLVIIGSGDEYYESCFKRLEETHPYKIKCFFGYSDELASLSYAASDMFLMPSAFEPCGLGQMIALKYGSLPIVRETGGLNDSVEPYNEYELTGNGFSFTDYNAHDMEYVIKYAFRTYSQENCWNILVQNAMDSDFSFKKSALKYINLYNIILNK